MRPKKFTFTTGRKAIGIMVLLLALTLVASSQEPKNVQLQDTSVGSLQSFQSEPLLLRFSFFHFQSQGLRYQPFSVPSMFNFLAIRDKTDLVSPWKLELENREQYHTMRTILESIELGGVAYIGYQHIKKYGLK